MTIRFLGILLGLVALPVLVHGAIMSSAPDEADRLDLLLVPTTNEKLEQLLKQGSQPLKKEEELSKEILLHVIAVGHKRPFPVADVNLID